MMYKITIGKDVFNILHPEIKENLQKSSLIPWNGITQIERQVNITDFIHHNKDSIGTRRKTKDIVLPEMKLYFIF